MELKTFCFYFWGKNRLLLILIICIIFIFILQLPDHRCNASHKPKTQETCNTISCPMWETDQWSEVSFFIYFLNQQFDHNLSNNIFTIQFTFLIKNQFRQRSEAFKTLVIQYAFIFLKIQLRYLSSLSYFYFFMSSFQIRRLINF